MSRTDQLFQLVKAMSRADKRNFKLLAQITAGEKKYIQVFDALDRSDQYHEGQIRAAARIRSAGQLAVVKNYLYHTILRSLAYFHRPEEEDTVNGLALQARALMERGLHGHAIKLLRKARQDAAAAEDHAEVLALLALERRAMRLAQEGQPWQAATLELVTVERAALEAMNGFLALQALEDELTHLRGGNVHMRSPDEADILRLIQGNPAIMQGRTFSGERERVLYHCVRMAVAEFAGEDEVALQDAQAVLEVCEGLANMGQEHCQKALEALIVAGRIHARMGRVAEAQACLGRARGLIREGQPGSRGWALAAFRLEGQIVQAGFSEEGLDAFLQGAAPWFAVVEELGDADQGLQILFVMALLCFIGGRQREALRWMNKLLALPRVDFHQDIQCAARLLNLMIHLELGNDDLVEHSLVSAYRFIFKRKRIFPAERMILRHLKALASSEPNRPLGGLWQDFLAEVEHLSEEKMQQPLLLGLGLRGWILLKLDQGQDQEGSQRD